ncbi:SpoIIE family protein phosphatase [Streptomyces sp. NPDC087263]|uniref:SpoIIE family protein phosphatase n=1 Tax=Streptomyces sp. NPDC087263 TaxID=3365773 RepID=UPI0037F6979B
MTDPVGEDAPGAQSPFAAMADAFDSIGTTLDERITGEELAAFVCRHFCEAPAVDLPPADAPAATQHPHAPDLSRVATAGDPELLGPVARARGTAPVRAGTGRGVSDQRFDRPDRAGPTVVLTGDGTGELLRLPVGPPLGTGVGGYERATRKLTPDDTLMMCTDGLVERRGEDLDASLARLAEMRLPPGAGVDELLDEVLVRLNARHAEDDVAVLAARIRRRNTT